MLTLAFSAVALLAATDAAAQAPAAGGRHKTERFKGREVVAGQVLVKFSSSAQPQDVEHAKGAADVAHERKVGGKGVRLLQSRSKDAETLVRELSARRDVVYAEPNYIIRPSAVPDDPSFGQQWALQNTGYTASAGAGTPGADIGAVSAWELSTGSRANVVAVIDTGVDSTHPDLAANMWSAPAAFTVNIGGETIRCEAGTHGFNAVTKTCDPADEYDHGTHVAGIVGASGNNGVGGAGVNWTASIMDIKFIDAAGSGTLSDAIDAIDFAIQAKQALGAGANVRVLSNSWGWNGQAAQSLLDEINRAGESEMLFVAGAGNGGADRVGDNNDVSPFYPASYDAPNVVSVAATDNNDALASFSNYSATRVHLGAPGVLIYSTIKGGSYDYWSGTSMATPQVSGAAALVLSRCTLDTAGLKNTLLGNVDPVGSLSAVTVTGGRLNVSKALGSCATATPTPAPTPTPSATPAPNSAPSARAGGPYGAQAGQAVQFYGGGSTDSDGTISSYRWEFGDGTTGAGAAPAHAYTSAGTYTVTLTVTDNSGASGSATTTATISAPPAPGAGGTGTQGRLARWADSAGTLSDSSIAQSADGKIGIGTSTPGALLTVQGALPAFLGSLNIVRTTGATNGFGLLLDATGTGNNNLGLAVNGDPKGAFAWDRARGFIGFVNYKYSVNDFAFRLNIDGSMTYNDGATGAERFRLNPSGNVGVGTATPQSTLQVNGYIQLGLTAAAPPAADCDAEAEYGRMKVDAVGVKLYVCTSAGWKSAALQ